MLRIIFWSILIFISKTTYCQNIAGPKSADPMASAKEGDLLTGGVAGDVNIFNGTLSTSYSLGSVSTPGGLHFDLSLSHNSIYNISTTAPVLDGVPYGHGWHLGIPTISVSNEDFNKFITKEIETFNSGSGKFMPCNGTSTIYYTPKYEITDFATEGSYYWFAPELNIPGVASGRLIYKGVNWYADVPTYVFVLQTFENFIEVHLDQAGTEWTVVLPDGTQYLFSIGMKHFVNASNLRYIPELHGSDPNVNVLDKQAVPKLSINTWYVSTITNANKKGSITFNYNTYGNFTINNNYTTTGAYELSSQNLLKGKFNAGTEPTSEILLKSVESETEKLELNYTTYNNIGEGNNLLETNQPGVTRRDSMYNEKVIKLWNGTGSGGETFNSSWYLYKHAKNKAGSASEDATLNFKENNPYVESSNISNCFQLNREWVSTNGGGMSFAPQIGKSGYLESKRIPISSGLVPGDMYQVDFKMNSQNSLALLDINIATGHGDVSGSYSPVYENCYNRANGESLFTTFDKAIKCLVTPNDGYEKKITATFSYPNQPNEYGGFAIQIGPANSDHNFKKAPTNAPVGLLVNNLPIPSLSNYSFVYNNPCSTNDQIYGSAPLSKSGAQIPRNFGLGMPWRMMSNYYSTMHQYFDFVNTTKFWWKQTNFGTHQNKAIAVDNSIKVDEVALKRISKNLYLLENVKKFVSKDYSNPQMLTLVSHIKFSYEAKQLNLFTTTQNYYSAPQAPQNLKSYINGNRTVVLLKAIRIVPNTVTTNFGFINHPTSPTTWFFYSQKNNSFNNNYYSPGAPYPGYIANSSVFAIDSIVSPLGATTIFEYNPIQNPNLFTYNSDYLASFQMPVNPESESYLVSTNLYIAKYNESIGPNNCSDCNTLRIKSMDPLASKLYLTVKSKKILDLNPTFKHFTYKYFGFQTKNDYPSLPQTYAQDLNLKLSTGYSTVKVINMNSFDTLIYSNHTDVLKWSKVFNITHKTNQNQILSETKTVYRTLLAFENGAYRSQNAIPGFPYYSEYSDPTRPQRASNWNGNLDSYYNSLKTWLANDPNANSIPLFTHYPTYAGGVKYLNNAYRWLLNGNSREYLNSFFLCVDTIFETKYPTAGNPISSITALTYFDADHKGFPTSSAAFTTLLGSAYTAGTRLSFAPSFGLASVKKYSPQLPNVYTKTEYYYVYDLVQNLNYITQSNFRPKTTIPVLKRVYESQMKNLPLETRTTNYNPTGGGLHVNSQYYTYKIIQNLQNLNPDINRESRDIVSNYIVLDYISQQTEPLSQPQVAPSFNASNGSVIFPCKIRTLYFARSYNDFLQPCRTEDIAGIKTGKKYLYHGEITKDSIGYDLTMPLVSQYDYNTKIQLISGLDPNGTAFSFSYDAYARLVNKYRNGVELGSMQYNNWIQNATHSFYERTKSNFIQTNTKITSGLTHSVKTYIDPLGRKILSLENSNYAKARTFYDIYDRSILTVKPFIPPATGYPLGTYTLTVNDKEEFTYEVAPRGRVLKSSKFGESISGSYVSNYSYSNKTLAELMTAASAAGQSGTSLLPPSGSIFEMTQVTDEDNKKSQAWSDAFGRKIADIAGNNYAVTLYMYDMLGNVSTVSNPLNQSTTYTYNYLNQLYSKTSVDEGSGFYAYDKAGRMVAFRNAKDEVRVYQYDELGRMVFQGRTSVANSSSLFNNQGLDWVNNTSWNTSYNSIISSSTPEKRWRYNDYDMTLTSLYCGNALPYLNYSKSYTAGRLTQTTSYNNSGQPTEFTWYSYNADGFLKWEMKQMKESQITNTSKGLLTRIDYTQYTLDGKVLVKNIDLNGNHTLDLQFAYNYDNFGRLTDVFANFKNQTNTALANKVLNYVYDDSNNLVSRKNYFQSKGQISNPEPCYNNIPANTYYYNYDVRYRQTGLYDSRSLFNLSLFYNNNNPMVVSGTTISTNYNGNINATRLTRTFTNTTNGSIPGFAKSFTQCYTYDAINRLELADNSDLAPTTGTNSDKYGDEDPVYDKIGNISSMYRGLTNGSSYSYLQSVYNYTSGTNKLNTVTQSGVTSRAFGYDLTGNTTQETFSGVSSNYSFGRSNLPINFTKSGVTTNYIYSASDERIIKHNTSTNGVEYYIKSSGGEDLAVFNSANNSLVWYVQGEVKFPHHSTPDFSANNSNTGATSYTTDPYAIALTQTNSYLYPDMEYNLTDHLGSTRMMYKLNFTCAGVYQNATIQYL
ncbi:MAG: RHS repeat protein, partial [Saprospiraceae bacterium]|nr:RHS repeat protein [Saprospiraceae bacterium]